VGRWEVRIRCDHGNVVIDLFMVGKNKMTWLVGVSFLDENLPIVAVVGYL